MMQTESENALWEALAGDWDARMGLEGNRFHRELIRPATLRLLEPQPGERILDAACGNGLFAGCLAALGAQVAAFDYSPQMIARAKERWAQYLDRIQFSVADATDFTQVTALGGGVPFDKAVSNMAVMDISDIAPLLRAVYAMLKPGGVFVFSAEHPCFRTPGNGFTEDGKGLLTYSYIEPQYHAPQALADNEKRVHHWHRPLRQLLGICFEAGFALDGLEEPVFAHDGKEEGRFGWYDIPAVIVFRVRKIAKKGE